MEKIFNILLIEDNPSDAKLIDIYLKEAYNKQYLLSKAETLSQGLAFIKKSKFDIIISDLNLPDSNGLNTFENLFYLAVETPVIVLTGLNDEKIGINAMKSGAQDFLIKGKIESKELKRSIDYSIERFRLLNQIYENTQKLEEAQELAHLGSWEWEIETNTLTWSDELYRIYGLDPKRTKITIDNVAARMHPDDIEHAANIIWDATKTHAPYGYEHLIIRPNGTMRSLYTRGKLIVNEAGKPIKIIGTAQDITERKREKELERMSLVASKSYNAVVIANKEGKIEWVNEGFTKLFGYKLEEVEGTFGEILRKGEDPEVSSEKEYYISVLKEKHPLSYENKNYSKNGKEYWVLTSLSPVLNEKGEVDKIISIYFNINKQKKAEYDLILANDELKKAKKQLENSLKIKEIFLANMSHEIRTPMNAIIGFTNLILKTPLSSEQNQYIQAVKTSGEKLLVIINDILDFSKIDSGKVEFEQITFNLRQLISKLITFMSPKPIENGIKFWFEIDEAVPECLTGDPTRLNQILTNLVANAIKFTLKGEIKITVSLIAKDEENAELVFSVNDTGIGIKDENLSKIFESFNQATNDTTRKYGGTGLGLSITKQLVEKQGGKITVKSKVDEGSCFSFTLKLKTNLDSECVVEERKPQDEQMSSLKGINVLLVEDNILNQILAKKVLNNWNCNVEIADNGFKAVEKVRAGNFDIVLMDIQLPEMDGYNATSHIRNDIDPPKCHLPIIAMTAHAITGEAEKCMKVGMDDYISKPFDETILYHKITHGLTKIKKNGNLR